MNGTTAMMVHGPKDTLMSFRIDYLELDVYYDDIGLCSATIGPC